MSRSTVAKLLVVVGISACAVAALVWAREHGMLDVRDAPPNEIDQRPVFDPTPKPARALRKVKTVEMFPIPMTEYLQLPGSVEAAEDIDVGCEGAGRVSWVGVDAGDHVEAGQVLAKLDVDMLQAAVDEARTHRDLAAKRFARIKALQAKDITSQDAYDEAQSALAAAEASLRSAQIALEDGTVTAPMDGIMDRVYADVGEYLNPGDVVGKLICMRTVKVVVNVPERDVLFLSPDQPARIEVDAGDQSLKREGTVSFLPMSSDTRSRTFPVEIAVDNADLRLRPGMIVDTYMVRRERQKTLGVPFFTIVDSERGKTVFVEQDGVARERVIDMGLIQGGLVEVTRGLMAGDRLIVVGQRDLVEGEAVEVTEDLTNRARMLVSSGADLGELVFDMSAFR